MLCYRLHAVSRPALISKVPECPCRTFLVTVVLVVVVVVEPKLMICSEIGKKGKPPAASVVCVRVCVCAKVNMALGAIPKDLHDHDSWFIYYIPYFAPSQIGVYSSNLWQVKVTRYLNKIFF